jgi:hypothetical protein
MLILEVTIISTVLQVLLVQQGQYIAEFHQDYYSQVSVLGILPMAVQFLGCTPSSTTVRLVAGQAVQVCQVVVAAVCFRFHRMLPSQADLVENHTDPVLMEITALMATALVLLQEVRAGEPTVAQQELSKQAKAVEVAVVVELVA